MPIEHSAGGTVITGDSIDFLKLVAQRGAVKLELAGIKMHRGPVLWKQLRNHYGIRKVSKITGKPITGLANKQDVYNWLDAKVNELRPKQEHITNVCVQCNSSNVGQFVCNDCGCSTLRQVREVGGEEIS